jgi:endonuclease/exonuclease/phosphatase family metal-dependent hydrolase
MGKEAEFGNAIISNLTLSEKQTHFTNLEYKKHMSINEDDYNVRNFQHVVLNDQDGKSFHIINHHGYHIPGHKRGNDFTLKACQQIVDYATQLDGPVIITGDFNLEPDSESIELINDRFRNLTKEYSLQTTRTDLTHKSEACDYIFVNGLVDVKDFYASDIVASDHQGLVLEFEVSKQAN